MQSRGTTGSGRFPDHRQLGPYTLVDRIAVGGMAEVFRALEPRPVGEPRVVVLKRMLPHVAEEPSAAAMFSEEAAIGGLVRHPNVVHLLGRGEFDGQPFLVLEYVPGCDLWRLSRFLRRQGERLPRDLALYIVLQLLEALDAVHRATDADGQRLQIVHRDVSPSNVLLSIQGDVKLGDFGIARGQQSSAGRAGSGTKVKGKLGYLAPEQVVGAASGQRSDLFSVGVIAAELLMGAPLFSGGSELSVLLAIRDSRIERFDEAARDLPAPLADAVRHALAPEPDERLPDAASFARLLAPYGPEDPARTRRTLGELVTLAQRAMQEAPAPMSGTVPTVDLDRPGEVTPVILGIEEGEPTPLVQGGDGEATSELLAETYTVYRADGQLLGRFSFAALVEAIATGELGPHDRVATGERAPEPLAQLTALARHLPPSSFTPLTREANSPVPPNRRYGLADGGIVRAIASTALCADAGLWLCENETTRKEVYVHRGKIELVTSTRSSELLGEYLVARSVIERAELDVALALMPRFEGRLGDTLVALGMVSSVDLFQHIAAQGDEKLRDLFLWQDGMASFYRDIPVPPSAFPLGIDPWALLDSGIGLRLAHGLEEATFRSHMLDHLRTTATAGGLLDASETPAAAREVLLQARDAALPLEVALAVAEDRLGGAAGAGYRTVVLLLHLSALHWVA